jgi:hypothetical protein
LHLTGTTGPVESKGGIIRSALATLGDGEGGTDLLVLLSVTSKKHVLHEATILRSISRLSYVNHGAVTAQRDHLHFEARTSFAIEPLLNESLLLVNHALQLDVGAQ